MDCQQCAEATLQEDGFELLVYSVLGSTFLNPQKNYSILDALCVLFSLTHIIQSGGYSVTILSFSPLMKIR